ncbi:unnamed protein product [Enterobius vermicularis]|uniref:Histidine-rich glycoprotein n=1 Tax=Enterobius vermicularis TaxID=51028 RepID=A0A0N4UVE0_ENTVE|nr:unnamed protein product [Enterobius vermicularis]
MAKIHFLKVCYLLLLVFHFTDMAKKTKLCGDIKCAEKLFQSTIKRSYISQHSSFLSYDVNNIIDVYAIRRSDRPELLEGSLQGEPSRRGYFFSTHMESLNYIEFLEDALKKNKTFYKISVEQEDLDSTKLVGYFVSEKGTHTGHSHGDHGSSHGGHGHSHGSHGHSHNEYGHSHGPHKETHDRKHKIPPPLKSLEDSPVVSQNQFVKSGGIFFYNSLNRIIKQLLFLDPVPTDVKPIIPESDVDIEKLSPEQPKYPTPHPAKADPLEVEKLPEARIVETTVVSPQQPPPVGTAKLASVEVNIDFFVFPIMHLRIVITSIVLSFIINYPRFFFLTRRILYYYCTVASSSGLLVNW